MPGPIDALMNLYIKGISSIATNPSWGETPARRAQIAQYQNPLKKILPDAPHRPTSLTKFQDRRFVSERAFLPENIPLPVHLVGQPVPDGPTKIYPPANYGDTAYRDTKTRQEKMTDYKNNSEFSQAMFPARLGKFTASLGKDQAGNYLSIFDSWDFDEPNSSGLLIGEDALRKSGKPFNVYDRIYYNPGPNNTIPAMVHPNSRLTDIELPASPMVDGLKRAR